MSTYEWVYTMSVFLGLGYLTQDDFYSRLLAKGSHLDIQLWEGEEVWSPIYVKGEENGKILSNI